MERPAQWHLEIAAWGVRSPNRCCGLAARPPEPSSPLSSCGDGQVAQRLDHDGQAAARGVEGAHGVEVVHVRENELEVRPRAAAAAAPRRCVPRRASPTSARRPAFQVSFVVNPSGSNPDSTRCRAM